MRVDQVCLMWHYGSGATWHGMAWILTVQILFPKNQMGDIWKLSAGSQPILTSDLYPHIVWGVVVCMGQKCATNGLAE